MAKLLIIDDDRAARRTLELAFGDAGHDVSSAGSVESGLNAWRNQRPDLVLLDLMLPDGDGISVLTTASQEGLGGVVIMITGHQDLDKAIAAMRAGAFDYIHKPLNIDELEIAVEKGLNLRESQRHLALVADLASERSGDKIVGQSRSMVEVHKQIGLASRGATNVLITGESGTGKELVARAIHRFTNADAPFIPLNCSALVPTLLESELFGHVKGAFTGANENRPGRLELAGEGTLFLDEIGDLDPSLQIKLLRVLQERTYERVGSNVPKKFNARVIAATHRDLAALVREGGFREDLYYRLKVIEIHLQPLRERPEDIEPLIEHLLGRIDQQLRRNVGQVPTDVLARMKRYPWPGNVRELENRLTAGVISSPDDTLRIDLPTVENPPEQESASDLQHWNQTLESVEKSHIERVLAATKGNLGRACEILGISRPTLRRKMLLYGFHRD
ncbi:MAG: sigma-54 dependent transcriptional regulator [bacterium]